MTTPFEVIAAFVDGERVDPEALKQALSEPAGRDYLADIVALREVVADRTVTTPVAAVRPRRVGRWIAAAAVVALSVGGGFALGHRTAESKAASAAAAPKPTRVIELKPGVEWHETGGGQ